MAEIDLYSDYVEIDTDNLKFSIDFGNAYITINGVDITTGGDFEIEDDAAFMNLIGAGREEQKGE